LLNYEISLTTLLGLLIGLIFIYFYSFFVSLTVYSVQRDVRRMDIDTYWNKLMKDSAFKIFFVYLFLAVIFFLISALSVYVGWGIGFAVILNLFISLVFMYAPQSIVLDGSSPIYSLLESLTFFISNPWLSLFILFTGSLLLSLIYLIEFLLSLFFIPGNFVSVILVLFFVVPFIEQMKSYAFILKFDLIGKAEIQQSKIKIKSKKKIKSYGLREQPKGGKL
jgi:hypothetical protein